MDNSKDVSQRLKYFKKFLGWGLLASTILVLSYIVYINMFQGMNTPPDGPAQTSLRSLVTVLEAYYAEHQKYPQPDEALSLSIYDGVTASFVTSRDGQHYCAMAFHRKGNNYILMFSESSIMWLIPFSKQGLVTARPL